MAEATAASPSSQNHTASPSNRRGRRQRGSGRPSRQTGAAVSQEALALRPSSLAPVSQSERALTFGSPAQNSSQSGSPSQKPPNNSRRNGRQGRHTATSNSRHDGAVGSSQVAGRRRFGGQLTSTPVPESDTSIAQTDSRGLSLRGDADDFVPGRQHRPRTRKPRHPPPTHAPGPRPRAGSIQRSNAEDILTRTHEDIATGAYECLICSDSVHSRSKIWSCHTCWAVLHQSCIRKWSANEAATVSQGRTQNGELPPPRQWRCPGCNLPQDNEPAKYACWCGKESDPTSIPGLPPHSCGQSCSKPKTRPRRCPHVCDLVCHAGPCPPCTAMGPEMACFCGKNTTSKRCSETDYDQGWACGEICNEPMPCGDPDHLCQKPCHEGLCGACEVPLDATCYCGQVTKQIICNDKEDEQLGRLPQVDGSTKEWVSIFSCDLTCSRAYDCGKHTCEQACHNPGTPGVHHCPREIDVIDHCICGKTSLVELGIRRASCEDPIPVCDKVCGRKLTCGHDCPKICHTGDCPPCLQRVEVECVCGRTSSGSICSQGMESKPLCFRACRSMLNCGRHACEQHCCSGEKRAAERLAAKRKHRPLGSAPVREDFEAEHICVKICGRSLSCGNPDHTCQELCHKGKCNTCPNAVFDEISCHCGQTVLYPPLPCGTRPPPCRSQCQRPSPCNLHPPVQHNCHSDEESCPKCPFLTAKSCMCGKKTLKNQPCFSNNVSCGTVCGNPLRCGEHTCRKPCHPPGECEDAAGSCVQPCGKPKPKCGHPDLTACHVPTACRENRPCQSKMVIACDCARQRVETKCLATASQDGNLTKKLSCDEECARLERNQQLARALNVDPSQHSNDHIPYETATLRLYQENTKFAVEHEQKFRLFAADDNQRRLRFSPMKQGQRAFLHALAEDFGFESESLDPEPHRHVVVFKTPRFVSAPMKTIADCIRIRALQGKLRPIEPASSANASDTERDTDERVPYNGFVLSNPRFGLTIDEMHHDLAGSFRLAPSLAFDIAFLPNEEIVLKSRSSSATTTLAPGIIQSGLKGIKSSIATAVADKKLAGGVSLCVLDASMNLVRREQDANASAAGWSTVAKGLSRVRAELNNQGGSAKEPGSRFLVLGKKQLGLKDAGSSSSSPSKPGIAAAGAPPQTPPPPIQREESIVDDWEQEMDRQEQAEGQTEGQGQEQEQLLEAASPSTKPTQA